MSLKMMCTSVTTNCGCVKLFIMKPWEFLQLWNFIDTFKPEQNCCHFVYDIFMCIFLNGSLCIWPFLRRNHHWCLMYFLRFSSQRASNAELWCSLCCYHEYKLWNKQLSCQWFETPWRLCDITAMHLVHTSRLILGLRPANERRRYKVTASLIGWAQAWTLPPHPPPPPTPTY